MRCCFLLMCLIAATYGQETQNTLEIYIRKTIENFRGKMKTGIPEINLPVLDPLKIPIIDLNIKEGIADVRLKITDLQCSDLSTFDIKSFNLDMSTMTLSAVIVLSRATAKSQYNLDGTLLGFVPLYGKGIGAFGINDLEISVRTQVNIGSGKLHLETFGIQITFRQIQVYLENILGGGNLGDVVNTVINSFGKPIFDSQKGNIEWTLNNVIRTALNKELAKINLGKITYANKDSEIQKFNAAAGNAYLDRLFANLRPILKKKEPFTLPTLVQGFPGGAIQFNYGYLSGVFSLFRTGNVLITTNPQTGIIQLAGSVGVTNILVAYQMTVVLLGKTMYPVIRGVVHAINIFLNVFINMKTGQKAVAELTVLGISTPQLILENLPPVIGQLASVILKLSMPKVVETLKGLIHGEVRNLIQQELNKIKYP